MSDDETKKRKEILRQQQEEAKRTREWLERIVARKDYDRSTDELEALIKKLRAEGCDRDSFVVAALMAVIGIDMTDDVSTDRLVSLLRKFMACAEVAISLRRAEAAEEVAAAGGAQA